MHFYVAIPAKFGVKRQTTYLYVVHLVSRYCTVLVDKRRRQTQELFGEMQAAGRVKPVCSFIFQPFSL